MQTTRPTRLWPSLFILLIVLVAIVIRIPGLFSDFWFDEIWSWSIARQLHSPLDILVAAPALIDNNHPLNTLWLYLLGDAQPVWLYRLPALLAGVGSVFVAIHIMQRRGNTHATIAALLIGLSYPLVFYSSEARGYALVVFFSLLALDALELALTSPTPGQSAGRDSDQSAAPDSPVPGNKLATLLFPLAASAGFLSHLTFLHVYAGAFIWSAIHIIRNKHSLRSRLTHLARLHLLPLATATVLFQLFVSRMVIGGAVPTSPIAVLTSALSLSIGGPPAGHLAMIVAVLLLVIWVFALVHLARRRCTMWIFLLVAVLVSPALACVRELCFAEHPQPLMVRYFSVCLAMLLLSLCPLIASVWNSGKRVGRGVVAGALAVLVLGNLYQLRPFFSEGRGQYSAALRQIIADSPNKTIRIASDNPMRTRMLLKFYGRRLPAGVDIVVVDEPARWLILNRFETIGAARTTFSHRDYALFHSYGYSGLSGWSWHVYQLISQ